MNSTSILVVGVTLAALAGAFGAQAQTTTTYGRVGSLPTQTTTTKYGSSMSQTTQVTSPSVRVGNTPVSVYGGTTTTVTGGYTVGGSGQPLTNNTTGSRSSTTYGAGVQLKFK